MSLVVILFTCIVSIVALQNEQLLRKLTLVPYYMHQTCQWHRIITHGFIHADYMHLAINMLVLYSFGMSVEGHFHSSLAFRDFYCDIFYLLFYLGGIIVASISTLIKQKEKSHYSSLGASGAVSAIVFAFIFFEPWSKIYFMAILPIPAALFGALYLVYTSYMAHSSKENVNHEAHFYGAIYGFLVAIFTTL
ncbi:MAG: rhomboid family intramembrane serine protease [Bacteroidales bacterium]